MYLHTDELQKLLATRKFRLFNQNIINFLKPGPRELYQESLKLVKKKNKKAIAPFFQHLTNTHSDLCQFLNTWHSACDAFNRLEWGEAKSLLQVAFRYYPSGISLKITELEEKIAQCEIGYQIQMYADRGNRFYQLHKWESALEEYLKAEQLYEQRLPFSRDEMDGVIEICKRGILFDKHISKANRYYANNAWKDALEQYQHAKAVYVNNFEPDLQTVEEKIEKSAQRHKAGPFMSFFYKVYESKSYIMFGGITIGMMSLLTLGYTSFRSNNSHISKVEISQSSLAEVDALNRSPEIVPVVIQASAKSEIIEAMENNASESEDEEISSINDTSVDSTANIVIDDEEQLDESQISNAEFLFAKIVENVPNEEEKFWRENLEVPEESDVTTSEAADETIEKPLSFTEVAPEFPGGESAMLNFMSRESVYPKSARQNGIEGKVFVRFVVNSNGTLEDIRVIKGIGYGCDEVAKDVVRKMPLWTPARHKGKKVSTWYTIPFTFKLE